MLVFRSQLWRTVQVLLVIGEKGCAKSGAVARELGVDTAWVNSILNLAARRGLLTSSRGPNGGYRLVVPMEQMPLWCVWVACAQPLVPNVPARAYHKHKSTEKVRWVVDKIWADLEATLRNTTLLDLAKANTEKKSRMRRLLETDLGMP